MDFAGTLTAVVVAAGAGIFCLIVLVLRSVRHTKERGRFIVSAFDDDIGPPPSDLVFPGDSGHVDWGDTTWSEELPPRS